MNYPYLKQGSDLVPLYSSVFGDTSATPLYDIVLALIQSNMRGVADDYTSADQYSPNVYMWNHGMQVISQASEPMSTPEPASGMGAANTFLKDYEAEALPVGRRLLVVNVARGGTGFATPSSNPFGGTGLHWRQDLANDSNNLALRGLETIQQAVTAAGVGSRIVACIANHGSTDGSNNMPKDTFKGYLQSYITWLRGQLNIPNVPYVMMQMRPDLVANETRHRIIDEAQTETATEMFKVRKAASPVGSEYYRADSVHFNAAGMRVIGHNLFDQWQAA